MQIGWRVPHSGYWVVARRKRGDRVRMMCLCHLRMEPWSRVKLTYTLYREDTT